MSILNFFSLLSTIFWWETVWKALKCFSDGKMIEKIIKFIFLSLSRRPSINDNCPFVRWQSGHNFFQSVFDGFCMMLCDRNVKMVIRERKIDFIARQWLIIPLKANDKHCENTLKTSACHFHKLHDGEIIKKNSAKFSVPVSPSTSKTTRKAHESLCLHDGFGTW